MFCTNQGGTASAFVLSVFVKELEKLCQSAELFQQIEAMSSKIEINNEGTPSPSNVE